MDAINNRQIQPTQLDTDYDEESGFDGACDMLFVWRRVGQKDNSAISNVSSTDKDTLALYKNNLLSLTEIRSSAPTTQKLELVETDNSEEDKENMRRGTKRRYDEVSGGIDSSLHRAEMDESIRELL